MGPFIPTKRHHNRTEGCVSCHKPHTYRYVRISSFGSGFLLFDFATKSRNRAGPPGINHGVVFPEDFAAGPPGLGPGEIKIYRIVGDFIVHGDDYTWTTVEERLRMVDGEAFAVAT